MRHVLRDNGFVRCPSCFNANAVAREMETRKLPPSWTALEPDTVIRIFGEETAVGNAIRDLLSGAALRAHAYGLIGNSRQAFMGALAYGFLRQNRGCQVLNSADLAARHFSNADNHLLTSAKWREPVILQLGHEVESKIGLFYFRTLLEHALTYRLPFVLVTDQPLAMLSGRYYDLVNMVTSVGFDAVDLCLNEANAST